MAQQQYQQQYQIQESNVRTNFCGFSFNLRDDEITTNESALNQKEVKELVPSKAVICTLSSDFGGMLTNMAYSDVTIVVAEKEFPAHKNILSGRK